MATVTLTYKTVSEVKRIIAEQNISQVYVRAGCKGGGCSGLTWVFTLDENYDEKKDLLEEQDGLKLIFDKRSALYLNGTTIDFYDDGMMKRGFVFKNDAIKSTCGCGSSVNF